MKDEQDDITLDEETGIDDSVLAEESQGETIKKLREKLRQAEIGKLENLTNWQKDKADFVNARKRDEERAQEVLKFAKADLISQILPVLDTFDLAMRNKQSWEALPKDWRMGMESIQNQLLGVLVQNGVAKIEGVGEAFDPNVHEAIDSVPVETAEKDHTIIEVLQPGFSLSGKVLRPAKVRVGQFTAS